MAVNLAALPHHDGSPLYVSTQSPALGDTVQVRVRVPLEYGVTQVRTRSNPNREPRFDIGTPIASPLGEDAGAQWWQVLLHIENEVHGYRFLLTMADGSLRWLNATGVHFTETLDSADFRLVTHTPPPEWVKSQVIYQIFPDRFGRSAAADARTAPEWAIPAAWDEPVNQTRPDTAFQFYGGDLDGVIEHLDHLERLGVTLLYLTPVFPARSNHRYDSGNFTQVDPLLGGDEALIRLVTEAHARGFKVIGDLTSNHSGDTHEWFQAAHGTPSAPESEFYYFTDDQNTRYASWLGVSSLPKFNWASAVLRRRFIEGPHSVVAKWLSAPYHFDGWRIDVGNMTGRYLEDDFNQDVRRTIRETMVEVNPDTILLGESTNDAAIDYQGDAWHGAMTYPNFTRPLWGWLSKPGARAEGGIGVALGAVPQYTGVDFFRQHTDFIAGFPWRVRQGNMNALDTHDTPRFATSALPGTVPVAFGLAVTLPGIPVVWAGDEFGLTGIDGEDSRTPIPWDRVDEVAERIDLYAELIALRRGTPALNDGSLRWLLVDDEVLVLVREAAEGSVLVVAARADHTSSVPLAALPGIVDESGALVATKAFGDPAASLGLADNGTLVLPSAGPAFHVWKY